MPGLIPQPFIDELLNRIDLVELIDSYVPLKKSGTSFVACCPFHSEKTPSFNVVFKKQFYHCFGCGASGNAISFIMQYLNYNFIETIELLAAKLSLQIPREGQNEKNQPSPNLYQLLDKISQFYEQTLKNKGQEAINYLRQRGLNGEIAKLYQLGYAPAGWQTLEQSFKRYRSELISTGMLIERPDGRTYDRYRHRIMFPIHDRQGRIIGFGGRALGIEQKPKYLNSPETIIFQKSRELYGLHAILKQQTTIDNIIIVEGYMDVIAVAQHGIHNVVAALGTSTSSYHIQLLSKYTSKLIFCFDGDAAGRQAAWRALESCLPHLNSGLGANFIFLPEDQDPDSLIRVEGKFKFLERLKSAQPLNQFFIETLSKKLDLLTAAGKSQLLQLAKPYLLKMQTGPYQQLLLNELARLTHIDSDRIHSYMQNNLPVKEHFPAHSISRSPIRLAIALLLQHPEIFEQCKTQIAIELLDGKDQQILQKLLYQVAKMPTANTATLIESWRNHEIFESLNKLASWDHQVPELALTKEFSDIISLLQKQNLENKIGQYLAKSRKEGLSTSEKLALQNLVKQKHCNIL